MAVLGARGQALLDNPVQWSFELTAYAQPIVELPLCFLKTVLHAKLLATSVGVVSCIQPTELGRCAICLYDMLQVTTLHKRALEKLCTRLSLFVGRWAPMFGTQFH